MNDIGVVLSGGGARGAYQAGVLKGLNEVCQSQGLTKTPDILTGVSAGAINAVHLGQNSLSKDWGVDQLCDLWGKLTADQVFQTDAVSLGKIGFEWIRELSFGAILGNTGKQALLNTAPLRNLLEANIDFDELHKKLKQGGFKALVVTAVDYYHSVAVSFVEGMGELPSWEKDRMKSVRAMIRADHIMASSAIPLLFPPIKVDKSFFGDGCVRNAHPCRPALFLGAKKLFVVGVREESKKFQDSVDHAPPSVGRVMNLLMNAVLLDSVEVDIQRLDRLNAMIKGLSEKEKSKIKYKHVPYVMVTPSIDIGKLAQSMSNRLPRLVRFLMKGLGPLEDSAEVISYLLFDQKFCKTLIEVGYYDALNLRENIIQTLEENLD